jgi:hypothetical protein
MKTFTDGAGRNWNLAMNIGSIKRVRDLLNVNLVEPEVGDPPLLTKLGTDIILLIDVIYALIKPQADSLNVSDTDFAMALGGETIKAATEAFYGELVDFFQKLGRQDKAKAAAIQQKMINLAVARMEKKIDQMKVEEVIDQTFGS